MDSFACPETEKCKIKKHFYACTEIPLKSSKLCSSTDTVVIWSRKSKRKNLRIQQKGELCPRYGLGCYILTENVLAKIFTLNSFTQLWDVTWRYDMYAFVEKLSIDRVSSWAHATESL